MKLGVHFDLEIISCDKSDAVPRTYSPKTIDADTTRIWLDKTRHSGKVRNRVHCWVQWCLTFASMIYSRWPAWPASWSYSSVPFQASDHSGQISAQYQWSMSWPSCSGTIWSVYDWLIRRGERVSEHFGSTSDPRAFSSGVGWESHVNITITSIQQMSRSQNHRNLHVEVSVAVFQWSHHGERFSTMVLLSGCTCRRKLTPHNVIWVAAGTKTVC